MEAPVVLDKDGETVDVAEVRQFLNDLRESGRVNMFGSAEYVEQTFDVARKDARTLVSYWMATFTEADA